MVIGGLDIGSAGAKITVLDKMGRMLHTGYKEYPVTRNIGEHEINAADIWDVVKGLLQEAAKQVPDLSAVGITSFGESFVVLGANNDVLMPTMMYTDPRGGAEADLLIKKLGDDYISAIAGTKAHSMFTIPKLMWIKANKPEIYKKIKYVFLIGDYLVYMLTGQRIIDYSLAARTMGLDIVKKEWSQSIFDAAGIDINLFSKLVPSSTCAGYILPDLAKTLGLPKNLRVVFSCHDQVAAAVGSNVTKAGMAADGGGSVQCITPVFSAIPGGGTLQASNYPVIPFLNDDTYCCYAFSFTGGSLVKWFVDNFCQSYKATAKERGLSAYRLLEEGIKYTPTGILVLPHFAGAATPYMDVGSRGVIAGLDLTQGPNEIFCAIMEGITYEMRLNIQMLAKSGIKVNSLNASGGCSKSGLWLQMKADILGIPVTRMSECEAGTIGGIMLTGVATGLYANIEEASKTLVKSVEIYKPRKEKHDEYEKCYQRYVKLYGAVRPLID